MKRLPLRAAAAALALPLLVSACSSGEDPTVAAPTSPAAAGPAVAAGVRTVSAVDALALVRRGAVVLDVRTPAEFAEGHLQGARNASLADGFEQAVTVLPRTGSYVVYCRSGNRSAQAAAVMARLGFTDVADAGGLDGLADAGGTVVR